MGAPRWKTLYPYRLDAASPPFSAAWEGWVRTLGVSGAGDVLYLAVAVDGQILDIAPYTFEEPVGIEEAKRLAALHNEAAKLVGALGVERVRLLDAESSYSASYAALKKRIAVETVLMLGCSDAGAEAGRVSRAKLRSLLGLPRGGTLLSLVPSITPPVGPKWARKRDLAALTAIAAYREQ